MSASLAGAVIGRLEARAKSQVLWHAGCAARAQDAAQATRAASMRAATGLRAEKAWSSFACAALTSYRERCRDGEDALHTAAAAAADRASAARGEQRHWATLRRGLERRRARAHAGRWRS